VPAPFSLDGDDCFELDADDRRLGVAVACGLRRYPTLRATSCRQGKVTTMRIGLAGLDRTSSNTSRRWLRDGHSAVGPKEGLHYLDCGTSGGVAGLERGDCLMIGGPTEAVNHLDPILRGEADPPDRVLSAMGFGFGGHEERKG
jgi:hypothetical protein